VTTPTYDADLHAVAVRYANGCDRRDAELFLSAFCDNPILVVHRPGQGPSQVTTLRGVPASLERRYFVTMHFVGQGLYEIDGDTAKGEVYCIASHIARTEGERSNHTMYIRYQDNYARRADGSWGIAERHLMCDWTETRPVDPLPS
jgi:hypothetical protein